MKSTETLASYVAEGKFSDFPQEVVTKAKYCILDSIGCALGGVQTELGKLYFDVAKTMGGNSESTVFGSGVKVSMANAAYTNVQLCNVLDFDDTGSFTSGHPGGPIIHSALAVGERVGVSGKDLITAVILGYEVCLRVGHAIRSIVMPPGAVHPIVLLNSSFKVFGAVTAAGKILGLGKEKLADAFGIAGSTAPGREQPTWATKPLKFGKLKGNFGIYALLGIIAALQAEKGLSAREDILDGDEFWTKVGANTCDFMALTRGLGREYLTMEVALKPTPSCRYTHPPITAVREALNLKKSSISIDDIEEIVLTGAQRLPTTEWDTMLDAQFRVACAVSLYLLGVEPGPAWYTNDRYRDPDVVEFAKKIKFVDDLEYWEQLVKYAGSPYKAEVKTKNGETVTARIEYMIGDPQNPLTVDDLKRKFAANAVGILGKEQSNELWKTLLNLEEVKISELMKLIYPKAKLLTD